MSLKRLRALTRVYRYRKNNAVYYNVADYSSGKRRFVVFSTLKEAKCEAELIAARMATGDEDVLELRSADRAAYLRATELLAPLGTPLESAIAQFVEATKVLHGTSIFF